MPPFIGKVKKSRSGCVRCKEKHVKCDESKPQCSKCVRTGEICPGYKTAVKWSRKYEKAKSLASSTEISASSDAYNEFSDHFTREAQKLQASLNQPTPSSHSPASSTLDLVPSSQATATIDQEGQAVHNNRATGSIGVASISIVASERDHTASQAMFVVDEDIAVAYSNHDLSARIQFEYHSDALSSYYFSFVCLINSGYDSENNPLRTLVADLMPMHPLVSYCVLSMSAAHMYQNGGDASYLALTHRTEAISWLTFEVSKLSGLTVTKAHQGSLTTAVLLGTVLLGMTSSWHDNGSVDMTYLLGARSLLQSASSEGLLPPQTLNFLVGLVAYWESITAFQTDQSVDDLGYLLPLCAKAELDGGQPNPWVGVSFRLFAHMATTGAIIRQLRLLKDLSKTLKQPKAQSGFYESLLQKAREVELQVRSYQLPPASRFQDTSDENAPLDHFRTASHVIMLCILLELYRGFPELVGPDTEQADSTGGGEAASQDKKLLLSLAINILTLLSTIPEISRTKAIQLLPFMIAGSALQHTNDSATTSTVPKSLKSHEWVMSLFQQNHIVDHWRSFVRNRLTTLHHYIGLDSVHQGLQIVEKVWAAANRGNGCEKTTDTGMIHWIDVMCDEKLETLLG